MSDWDHERVLREPHAAAGRIEDLERDANALVSDVEAMQSVKEGWYGGFDQWCLWEDGELDNALVEWPNLTITASDMKKTLAGE
jgi:hypothetical protein